MKTLLKKNYVKSHIFLHRPKFIFAWYDLWIGIFIDTKKKLIYFFPIPMFGIVYKYALEKNHYEMFGEDEAENTNENTEYYQAGN